MENESPQECIVREVFEETGQHIIGDPVYHGILISTFQTSTPSYGCIYFGEVESIDSFQPNQEISKIRLWDGNACDTIASLNALDRLLVVGTQEMINVQTRKV